MQFKTLRLVTTDSNLQLTTHNWLNFPFRPRYTALAWTAKKTSLPTIPSLLCLFIAVDTCLLHCCLAMAAFIHSTISAFSCHVTILLLLWYASCCVSIRQYLFINWSVYITPFTIKQNKHYCANICFLYACVVISLHVSTLFIGSSSGVFNTGFSYWITMNSYCIYD
jgi:hypothetical protein